MIFATLPVKSLKNRGFCIVLLGNDPETLSVHYFEDSGVRTSSRTVTGVLDPKYTYCNQNLGCNFLVMRSIGMWSPRSFRS